jgi:MarR family transcriptional regulator, negative regulator of the multidrug operon emrRAB
MNARRDAQPDRAFAGNVLGATVLALADRIQFGTEAAARHGANGPAALVSMLWYPNRSIGFLADRLRISHPGAVQLAKRLEQSGLVRRQSGPDGRTRLLGLTVKGEAAARRVLSERALVLERALGLFDDATVALLAEAAGTILTDLSDGLRTSEHICRMCDELSCPDELCPVERAEPSPVQRRGAGYAAGG